MLTIVISLRDVLYRKFAIFYITNKRGGDFNLRPSPQLTTTCQPTFLVVLGFVEELAKCVLADVLDVGGVDDVVDLAFDGDAIVHVLQRLLGFRIVADLDDLDVAEFILRLVRDGRLSAERVFHLGDIRETTISEDDDRRVLRGLGGVPSFRQAEEVGQGGRAVRAAAFRGVRRKGRRDFVRGFAGDDLGRRKRFEIHEADFDFTVRVIFEQIRDELLGQLHGQVPARHVLIRRIVAADFPRH